MHTWSPVCTSASAGPADHSPCTCGPCSLCRTPPCPDLDVRGFIPSAGQFSGMLSHFENLGLSLQGLKPFKIHREIQAEKPRDDYKNLQAFVFSLYRCWCSREQLAGGARPVGGLSQGAQLL